MISKEHHKHPKLARPAYGTFARTEWAILGAPCQHIRALADTVIRHLSDRYKCAYMDARHATENSGETGPTPPGAFMEYCDLIHARQLQSRASWNSFRLRQIFHETDVAFVNGNHYQASAQVVVLHPAKRASIEKRLAQLTRVELFLLTEDNTEVFDFLKDALPEWQSVPRLHITDIPAICHFFESKLAAAKPPLRGLVLAGGESRRMGVDKGAMTWHGKPQRQYIAELMAEFCEETCISCRPGQATEMLDGFPVLTDTFTGLGPFGAILSAFRQHPDSAWLVVACDLPLVNRDLIGQLVAARQPASVATAFQSPQNEFPEPLITIWEPKSYAELLSFLSLGYSCPRKVLINTDVHLIQADSPERLMNVNTPEELEQAQAWLSGKK